MDSINHALMRAIINADDIQRGGSVTSKLGLQPLRNKPHTHMAFAGAAGTDLHIELNPGPDVMNLWAELTSAGLSPPTALIVEGCAVILSPGAVEIFVNSDAEEPKTWVGSFEKNNSRLSGWQEQWT